MKPVKEMRWAFTMHVKIKAFSVRKRERVVYLSWKKWMFISDLKWPCLILAVVPPVMHNHSCQISDKLLILPEKLIAIRLPCSPCLWLSKRLMVVWSKHNTIDLSGGTINTAANIKWCCVMWSWTEKKHKSSIISIFWNCSLLCKFPFSCHILQ